MIDPAQPGWHLEEKLRSNWAITGLFVRVRGMPEDTECMSL
jgi:hypothetical protein